MRIHRPRTAIVLAAGATMLVAAPSAGARVIVNESIAGVSPGMTVAQVRAKLGKPDHVSIDGSPADGTYKVLEWTATSGRERRFHVDRRVASFAVHGRKVETAQFVWTESRRERTANGIGVGTSVARFTQLVNQPVHCVRFSGQLKLERCATDTGAATQLAT